MLFLGFIAHLAVVHAARVDVRPDMYTTRYASQPMLDLREGCVSWSESSNSFEFQTGSSFADQQQASGKPCNMFTCLKPPCCTHRDATPLI